MLDNVFLIQSYNQIELVKIEMRGIFTIYGKIIPYFADITWQIR